MNINDENFSSFYISIDEKTHKNNRFDIIVVGRD